MGKIIEGIGLAIFTAAAFLVPGAQFLIPSAIGADVSFGASLLIGILTPTPKDPGQQLTVSLNPNQPRAVAIGQCATAGSLVTFQTWGDNNSDIILVFALADHKCEALAGGWWMGQRMTINADGSVEQCKHKNKYYMWVRFYPGDWNDQIDAELLANCSGRWGAGAWGRGVCKVVVHATFNADAHPQGIAGLYQFVWEIQGAALYDRRQDSSVGGAGAQRWDDQSTWTFSSNGAVATENMLRGFGVENTQAPIGSRTRDIVFGLSLADQDLPFAANVAAMNACDEPVAQLNFGAELVAAAKWKDRSILLSSVTGLQVGDTVTIGVNAATVEEIEVSSVGGLTSANDIQGYQVGLATQLQYDHANGEEVDWRASSTDAPTVPRYACNGIISCEQDGQTALGTLLAACGNGRLLTGSGLQYAVLPGVAKTPLPRPDGTTGPTITDPDLRLDGPHQYKQYVQLDQIVNAVGGKWCNPAQYYTAIDLPQRISTADETEDGGRKQATFDVVMATNSSQGQRCQEIYRRRQRDQASGQVCLGPEYMCVEGGDWITWLSSRYGFELTFEVQNARWVIDDDQNFLGVVLDLQEIDDDVFGWDPDVDELALVNPKPLPSADPVVDQLAGFVVAPALIAVASGLQAPALAFTYDEVTDPYAASITFQWQINGQPVGAGQTFTATVLVDPSEGVDGITDTLTVTEGVIGGQIYEARAIINTTGGRASTFTDWAVSAITLSGTGVATPTATGTTIVDLVKGQGDLATLDQVDTGQVAFAAVTNSIIAEDDTEVALGALDAAPVQIGSISYSASGAPIRIDVLAEILNTDGDHDQNVKLTLERDGAAIGRPFNGFIRQNSASVSGGWPGQVQTFFFDDAAPAGEHTWTLFAQVTAGTGNQCTKDMSRISLLELKDQMGS